MNHVKFSEIAEKLGLGKSGGNNTENIFEYEICYNPEEQEAEDLQDIPEPAPDVEICNGIYRIIEKDYDNSQSQIPSKLSVTQITRKYKEEKTFDFKLKRPKFISERDVLTGAERGTAIHTFFQYCNFENAENDTENEINSLVIL